MAIFITTIKFTTQGLAKIQDTRKREAAFEAAAKKAGGKVLNVYWTMGPADGLVIYELPDDATAMALILHLEAQGAVQTQTARAFTAAEMEKILAKAAE